MGADQAQDSRDAILACALPHVAFDGWTADCIARAAVAAGYDRRMADAVFPGGIRDAVAHFSDWVDRRMLDDLHNIDPLSMRVRDRVHAGVMRRLYAMSPWREAARRAMTYWAVPFRSLPGGRVLWRSADRIWVWAGDTATDYNHYTKRTLLSGVIATTTLAWLNHDDADPAVVAPFLERRIDNVLQLGRAMGRFRGGR